MSDQTPGGQDNPSRHRRSVTIATMGLAAMLIAARHRLHADFWPLDNSRVAPNILAEAIQDAVVAAIVALIWPAVQRRIHVFADAKLAAIHTHLKTLTAHHQQHAADLAALQRSVDGLHAKHEDLAAKLERRRPQTTPSARNE